MDKSIFEYKRKSYIEAGQIYFWTATINKWMRLLEEEVYKVYFKFIKLFERSRQD